MYRCGYVGEKESFLHFYTGQLNVESQSVPVVGPYTLTIAEEVALFLLKVYCVPLGVILTLGYPSGSITLGNVPPGVKGYVPPSGAILPIKELLNEFLLVPPKP